MDICLCVENFSPLLVFDCINNLNLSQNIICQFYLFGSSLDVDRLVRPLVTLRHKSSAVK